MPFRTTQEVTVTFLGANTDQDVPHQLDVENPEDVNYEVLRQDRAGSVYDNRSAPRRAWAKNYIVLRSDVAGMTMKLRLSISR